MAVLVVFELRIRPEKMEYYLKTMAAILPTTRAFDGCELVELGRDAADPLRIVLVQRWTSREHQERYYAWRRERGEGESLVDQVAEGPATVSYYEIPEI